MKSLAAPNPPKKNRWFRRLLLSVLGVLLFIVIATGAVLLNPHWLSPLVEHVLKKYHLPSNVTYLKADFQWPMYRINTGIAVRGDGFSVHYADIDSTLNLKNLWSGKAFVAHSEISQLRAEVNIDSLRQYLGNNRGSPTEWWRFIPATWQISCNECDIIWQKQTINTIISAQGQSINHVNIIANDKKNNNLSVTYDEAKQQLKASSEQLHLQRFSGYDTYLRNAQATILLSDLWQSSANAEVHYAGITSSISIAGETENRLRLQSLTDNNPLTLVAEKQNDHLLLRSNRVDLNLLNAIKPAVLALVNTTLPQEVAVRLQQLNLSGELSGSVILSNIFNRSNNSQYQLQRADVNLNDVALKMGQQGIDHISGSLNYDENSLDYTLTLANSVMRLPIVLATPPAPLSGTISGSFDNYQKYLTIEQLNLANQHFKQLEASGSLTLSARPSVSLSGKLHNLKLTELKHYLPKQLPEDANTWLSKAFLNGSNNRTTFTIAGDLQRFLDDEQFVLQVQSQLKDGTFHYLPNNPDIAIKNAKLNVDRKHLSVTVNQAKLFTTINKKRTSAPLTGSVTISNLMKPIIDIHGKVPAQPLSHLLPLAERSIAKSSIKQVKKIAEASGTFAVDLRLLLNLLGESINSTLDLTLEADDTNIVLKTYPKLPIKKGKARVKVNQDGLQQLTIDAKLFKQPIYIDLSRQTVVKTDGYQVNIRAKKANPLVLLPHLKLLDHSQAQLIRQYGILSGADDYQVALRLKTNGDLLDVRVKSQWKNTTLKGFSLLNKSAGQPLTLQLNYRADKRRLAVEIGKDKTATTNCLSLITKINSQGDIDGLSLSNQHKQAPYQQGTVAIHLNSKALDIMKLRQFQQAFATTQEKSSKKRAKKPLAYDLAIKIDAAKINQNTRIPLALSGKLSNLKIVSPLLSGTVNYQNNRLRADIERAETYKLFNLFKKQSINPEGREVTTINLANTLPAMDINVNQLIYKDKNIGSGTIHTSIKDGRYSIDQILVNGQYYYFDASGYEAAEPQGIVTHLQADFRGENIGALIGLFKLNKMMDAKFIDMSLNLSWPGKAHTLNLRQSYGKAHLNAQNIKLINMSSRIGSVFGLMDIASIIRRVSLDFQNLTSSKLSFDTIKGNWNIGGGRAITRNAYATGSVVELRLVGAADLYRREFDNMDLTVIPKASNIFPIIGAVAGGLVGSAAGLLVQQTVGDNINRVVGLPYTIAGAWQAPKVAFFSAQNDSENSHRHLSRDYDTAN